MKLTLGQFSKQADIGKATAKRWVDNGWISAEKMGNQYRIDVSELDRVEDIKQNRWNGTRNSTDTLVSEQNDTPQNGTVYKIEIEFLKEKISDLQSQLKKSEDREEKLRLSNEKLIETNAHQTRLLEHKAEEKPQKGFIAKLLGV
jgi:excisionase family DNA binding protein